MNPYRIEGPALISFSGGRSSAMLLKKIIDAHGGSLPSDIRVVWANTGAEDHRTLDFVQECGERWNVPITWLEFDPAGEKMRRFKVVDHATASRQCEPFEAIIRERGYLPNPVTRFCTSELKIRTTRDFALSLGWDTWTNVLGLRYDEPHRVARTRQTRDRWENATPLFDARVTKADVTAFWAEQEFDLALPNVNGKTPHGNCVACLAGETEVVTSEGIKPIRDLAGTEPELLVPKFTRGFMTQTGHFVKAPVRSFGTQQLWRIELIRKRTKKTVYATADHRWFLVPHTRSGKEREAVTTSALRPGNRLKNLDRCPLGQERGQVLRLGAMRGFTFGDGAKPNGDRPGVLYIFEGHKSDAFVPMFQACCDFLMATNPNGVRYWDFYGLPRDWKHFPDLGESRSFLMGWLSGRFAADGHVGEDGNCILSAANPAHLAFARSLCAILGIQCSPARTQTRLVTLPQGTQQMSDISFMNLNRHHLHSDFFWLKHHRANIDKASGKTPQKLHWVVESVEPSDRIEEVFCATVEGIGAFGLADGLMTGNCFLKPANTISSLIAEDPSRADWWIRMEELPATRPLGSRFRKDRPGYAEIKAAVLAQHAMDFGERDALADCFCTE